MRGRLRLTAIGFAMLASQATAQITDPDQRMRWFNLQRLAVETRELDFCRVVVQSEPKYQAAYDSAASETATAIEAYIKSHPNARFKDESPDAYRYRVWSVAVTIGASKARSIKQLAVSDCELLTMNR